MEGKYLGCLPGWCWAAAPGWQETHTSRLWVVAEHSQLNWQWKFTAENHWYNFGWSQKEPAVLWKVSGSTEVCLGWCWRTGLDLQVPSCCWWQSCCAQTRDCLGDKTDTRQTTGCSSGWGRKQLLDKTLTAAAGSWLFMFCRRILRKPWEKCPWCPRGAEFCFWPPKGGTRILAFGRAQVVYWHNFLKALFGSHWLASSVSSVFFQFPCVRFLEKKRAFIWEKLKVVFFPIFGAIGIRENHFKGRSEPHHFFVIFPGGI